MRVHLKRASLSCALLLALLLVSLLFWHTHHQREDKPTLRFTSPSSSSSPPPPRTLPLPAKPWLPLHQLLHSSKQQRGSPRPNTGSVPTRAGEGGYLLALSFSEQLESGMFDMFQLADLSTSWKLRLAELCIINTHFGLPSQFSPNHPKLSDVYDLKDLNTNIGGSIEVSHDVVIPLEAIAKRVGPRFHMVVLQLVPYTITREDCANSNVDKYIQKVSSNLGWQASQFLNRTSTACVNTRTKVNYRTLFSTHPDLKQALQQAQHSRTKLLVVIPIWNGIRPYKHKFFYWDPAFKTPHYINSHAVLHSKQIREAASKFFHSLPLTTPTLGIHIRLERLLRGKKSAVTQCLAKLRHQVETLQDSGIVHSAFLFRDYGKYGSSTCAKINCSKFAREVKLDRQMEALGVHVLEYQPNQRKIRREHGFTANVEQEMLSLANYIITMGYGSFQQGIVERFKRHKMEADRNWEEEGRIFRICSQ